MKLLLWRVVVVLQCESGLVLVDVVADMVAVVVLNPSEFSVVWICGRWDSRIACRLL